MPGRHISPATILLLALLLAVAVIGTVISQALAPHGLGLALRWDEEKQGAVVAAASGPSAGIPAGTVLGGMAAGPDAPRFDFLRDDFAAEPATDFKTFAQYDAFLARQDRLHALQSGAQAVFIGRDGSLYPVAPLPGRPLAWLPVEFWVQVVVGFFAWFISAGVWSFRRDAPGARYLLLSGFATLLFAPFAAVYSTRELALAGSAFRWLCDLNFLGGCLYIAAMVGLLWYYPRRLGRLPLGPLLVAVYVLWWAAQEARLIESMINGRRSLVFAGLIATFALATVQWRATRQDPVARASLQWFLLSWLVGIGLFSALIFVPQVFGISTASLQGYAFSLFLLVYGGVAFGILRFRLFELGEWWFRVLLWFGAAVLFVMLDLTLLLALGLNATASLSLSLLVCGFVWLPLRGWLWQRVVEPARPRSRELFDRVIDISLAPSQAERERRGRALLQAMFEPLQIETGTPVQKAELLEDGLVMQLPPHGQTPPLVLRYPGGGRRLFNPRDLQAAEDMLGMLHHADTRRDAYNQGAREERSRIARDLHDDLGARLLTGLHQSGIEETRRSIQTALGEMRTIVNGLAGTRTPLDLLAAGLRHETAGRLEAAGLALDWPLPEADAEGAAPPALDYRLCRACTSMLRELVSNVLRHAGATRVWVALEGTSRGLLLAVEDDGVGLPALDGDGGAGAEAGPRGGHGLANLLARAADIGGTVEFGPRGTGLPGTRTVLRLPLEAPAPAAGGASGPDPLSSAQPS